MTDFLSLDNAALWALAVGFFSPPVISVIQQSRWSTRTQSLVAFGFYLLVAAVTAFVTGLFSTTDVLRLALLIFLAAGTSYKTLWKPTGISPAIEAATSPGQDKPRHSAAAPVMNITVHSAADPTATAQAIADQLKSPGTLGP